MTTTNRKSQPEARKPITQLVTFGKLQDILNSQASPEFKAACIEMGIEGSQRRKTASGPKG